MPVVSVPSLSPTRLAPGTRLAFFPKLLPLAGQPPKAPAPGESSCLLPPGCSTPQGWTKNCLGEHEKFPPSFKGVAGGDGAQSPSKALTPGIPGRFGHMSQNRNVRAHDLLQVRVGGAPCGGAPGVRRLRARPQQGPAPRVRPIVASRHQQPTHGAVVQVVGGQVVLRNAALEGASCMVVEVGPHGIVRPPAPGSGDIRSWAASYRAKHPGTSRCWRLPIHLHALRR